MSGIYCFKIDQPHFVLKIHSKTHNVKKYKIHIAIIKKSLISRQGKDYQHIWLAIKINKKCVDDYYQYINQNFDNSTRL
jgi:hypothetical protein